MNTTMTVSAREERFDQGCRALVMSPEDNPANETFYRMHAGLVAAWPELGFGHNYIHYASAIGCRDYPTALATMQALARDAKYPSNPIPSYSYSYEPDAPTESEARAEFNRQYKVAFPEKRANSKHANELWGKKKDAAMAIVQARYESTLKEFRAKESALNARNKESLAKYDAECARVNAMRELLGIAR